MKKIISIFAVILLLLSCAACGNKIEEKTGYTSVAKEEVYKNKYEDSNGDVSSTLEYHYPVLEGLSEDVSASINCFFKDRIAKKEEELKKNADNVTEYLNNFDIKGPQVTIIEYEEYYVDDYVASFIMKQRTATNPDEVEPTYEGISFSLTTGERLSVSKLTLPGKEEDTTSIIKARIITEANNSYSSNGTAISDEKKELINSDYDEDNFVTDGYSLTFIYDYFTLSEGSKTGMYECYVNIDDMGGYMTLPAEYGKTVETTSSISN